MRDFKRGGNNGRGGGRKFGGRNSGSFGGGRGDRQMYDAVCSNCGRDCQVPFRPTSGKPVLCSACFDKSDDRGDRRGNDRGSRFFGGREDRSNSRGSDDSKVLKQINQKLDQILELLGQ